MQGAFLLRCSVFVWAICAAPGRRNGLELRFFLSVYLFAVFAASGRGRTMKEREKRGKSKILEVRHEPQLYVGFLQTKPQQLLCSLVFFLFASAGFQPG